MPDDQKQYEKNNFDNIDQRDHFTEEELECLRISDDVSDEEYLIATWITYPSIWAEEFCANPRDAQQRIEIRPYQAAIMNDPGRRKILRLGRQIGKSMSIGILAVWEAYLFGQSKILVVCPRQTHVNNIFKEIRYFVDHDERLKNEVIGITKQPHEITFRNGSYIRGLTAGTAAAGIRGQVANTLFVDEADYVPEAAVEAIDPVVSSFKHPNIWLSSTPSGLRKAFYNKYYSKEYKPFHFPSCVSPDWTAQKEAQYRASYSIAGYTHEFDAEWGTAESSVFPRWAIEQIKSNSIIIPTEDSSTRQYTYSDAEALHATNKFKWTIIGIDWNKAKNGTRFVICGVDDKYRVSVIKKEKIDATEFTQVKAVNRILELNKIYNPNYIAVDVGYGSMQIEYLRLIGKKYPETGLDEKLIGIETGGSIDIKDIVTGEDRNTFVKPFMVENMARFVERGLIQFPEEENLTTDTGSAVGVMTLSDQLLNYEIDYYTSTDRPVYKGTEDHDLDAFMFCVYAVVVHILKSTNLYDSLPMVQPMRLNGNTLLKSLVGHTGEKKDGNQGPNVDTLPTRQIFGGKKNRNKPASISRSIGFSSRSRSGRGL